MELRNGSFSIVVLLLLMLPFSSALTAFDDLNVSAVNDSQPYKLYVNNSYIDDWNDVNGTTGTITEINFTAPGLIGGNITGTGDVTLNTSFLDTLYVLLTDFTTNNDSTYVAIGLRWLLTEAQTNNDSVYTAIGLRWLLTDGQTNNDSVYTAIGLRALQSDLETNNDSVYSDISTNNDSTWTELNLKAYQTDLETNNDSVYVDIALRALQSDLETNNDSVYLDISNNNDSTWTELNLKAYQTDLETNNDSVYEDFYLESEVISLFVNRTDWTTIDDYPTACPSGSWVSTIGDSNTCTAVTVGTGLSYTGYALSVVFPEFNNSHLHDAGNITDELWPTSSEVAAAYTNKTRSEVISAIWNFTANASMDGYWTQQNQPTKSIHLANKEYVDLAVSASRFDFFLTDRVSNITSYFNLSDTPTSAAESSFVTNALGIGDGQGIANFSTIDGQPTFTILASGVYASHFHAERTSGTRDVKIYFEIYVRNSTGSETLVTTSEETGLITTLSAFNIHASLSDELEIDGDQLVVKYYTNVVGGGGNVVVTLFAEGDLDSRISIATSSASLEEVFVKISDNDVNNVSVYTDIALKTTLTEYVANNVTVYSDASTNNASIYGAIALKTTLTEYVANNVTVYTDINLRALQSAMETNNASIYADFIEVGTADAWVIKEANISDLSHRIDISDYFDQDLNISDKPTFAGANFTANTTSDVDFCVGAKCLSSASTGDFVTTANFEANNVTTYADIALRTTTVDFEANNVTTYAAIALKTSTTDFEANNVTTYAAIALNTPLTEYVANNVTVYSDVSTNNDSIYGAIALNTPLTEYVANNVSVYTAIALNTPLTEYVANNVSVYTDIALRALTTDFEANNVSTYVDIALRTLTTDFEANNVSVYSDMVTENTNVTFQSVSLDYLGDEARFFLDGTNTFINWTDGTLILGSEEANTIVQIGKNDAGGSGTGTLRIQDDSGAYYTDFTQNDGTLNIQPTSSGAYVVINNDGEDKDTRIESRDNEHTFFIEASSNKVGINDSTPDELLSLNGGNLDMNTGQILAGGASAFTTVDTGQGANELFKMDQNVSTDFKPTFAGANFTANTTSDVDFCVGAICLSSAVTGDYTTTVDFEANNVTTYAAIALNTPLTEYVANNVTTYAAIALNTPLTEYVANNVTTYAAIALNTPLTEYVANNVTTYAAIALNTPLTEYVANNVTVYADMVQEDTAVDFTQINITTDGNCVHGDAGGKICFNATCTTIYSTDGATVMEACN